MTAFKKIGTLVGTAAVAAAAVGLTTGLPPASATPGQSGATLFIVQDSVNQGNYRPAILGRISMPQADAVGFLNNINNCAGGMNYYVFGDDEGDPDRYIVAKYFPGVQVDDQGYMKATSQGLEYRREILLRKNFLNEDSGVLDDNDEIYAQAHFKDSDCKVRVQTTQVITNLF